MIKIGGIYKRVNTENKYLLTIMEDTEYVYYYVFRLSEIINTNTTINNKFEYFSKKHMIFLFNFTYATKDVFHKYTDGYLGQLMTYNFDFLLQIFRKTWIYNNVLKH